MTHQLYGIVNTVIEVRVSYELNAEFFPQVQF